MDGKKQESQWEVIDPGYGNTEGHKTVKGIHGSNGFPCPAQLKPDGVAYGKCGNQAEELEITFGEKSENR